LATNAPGLLEAATSQGIQGRLVTDDAGLREVRDAVRWLGDGGIFIANTSARLLALAGTVAALDVRPRWRLVALDTVLRAPRRPIDRVMARLKGKLLTRAHLYVLYFVDTGGYVRYYGLP